MMTITKIGGGNASGYYTHENGFAGYLTKDSQVHGEPDGQWFGGALSDFGLDSSKPPTLEQMSRLLQGFDAETEEPLLKGAGQENRVQAFDITLSPPKSVSVALAALPDNQKGGVFNAQQQAVHRALEFLESMAGYRTGHGGLERVDAGKLLVATFEHSTSRENDPQLHHHCVVMNLIQDELGKTRALDASTIYQWGRTVGAIYHAELASNLKQLGYGIEAKGDKEVFEIVGVPADLIGHWSKRTSQIESVKAELGIDEQDHAGKQMASLSSRKKKGEIDRTSLFHQWEAEAKTFGFEPENIKGLESIEQEYSPDNILKELTHAQSVLTSKDIYQAVALRSVGSVDANAIAKRVELLKEQMVYLGCDEREAYYTTHETIRREQAIMDLAVSRQHEGKHNVDEALIELVASEKGLLEEQRQMVEHICLNDDAVVNIQGHAGTGKSYTLDAVRQVYESNGFKTLGVAPSGKAADGLQAGAGIQSSTIHKLLIDIEMSSRLGKSPPIDEKSVIVCDEAGMLDNKILGELLSKAADAGSKVVLVGDTEQIQSIRAGGMFRKLQEKLGKAELTQVFRQKDQQDIDALSHLRAGEAKAALDNYAERGLLSVEKNQKEAMRHLVDDWFNGGVENSIILASTNKDVDSLNRLARRRLKAAGKLIGDDVDVVSEGRKLKLAIGDRIVFKKNQKRQKDKKRYNISVKNGELGEVVSIHITKAGHDVIRVRMDDGREEEFRSRDYDHFSYGLAISNHRSQGTTFDKAYVYSSSVNSMINKEMAYVAMSRAKESSRLYFTASAFADDERERMYSLMSRSSQKTVGFDYVDDYQSDLPWQSDTVLGELERNSDALDRGKDNEAAVREQVSDDLAKSR